MELRINTDIWSNDLLTSSDNHQTRQAYNAEVRYPSPTTLRTKACGDEITTKRAQYRLINSK